MRLQTLIAAGLGLFLGLRYNEYISNILDTYVVDSNSLFIRTVVLIFITIVIVYISVNLEKFLDGK